ncbi:MAG: glycosyltransferase family 4 protein [Planctomycetes bacterium]|nr:glycosyltransferase family 4 protein [Planctomycetota bacterium]MBI3845862.1 glycosyltransferase family 4 protein [Planctomycetota bacterium]
MRISFLAVKGLPAIGGIEKLTEEIGARLAARGHEVVVYCGRESGTTSGEHRGMRLVALPSVPLRSLRKLSLVCLGTFDCLRPSRRPDVAHYHAVGPSLFCGLARLAGIRTVVQIHGLEWRRPRWGPLARGFFRLADGAAVRWPHAATAVSRGLCESYEERFGRPVRWIPTGVTGAAPRAAGDLPFGLEPGRFVLFAARLVADKGVHVLIDAWRGVRTNLPLVIAGDAAGDAHYRRELDRRAAGDGRIRFVGYVAGAPLEALMSHAYLFVLPSSIEGMPIALLEAMSFGACPLASDIPENREALGGRGFTFRCGDVDDLRARLQDLVDRGEIVEVARVGLRESVLARYSWDRIALEFESLYAETIASGLREAEAC